MTEKLKVYIEELLNLTENIKEKQTEINLLKEQKEEVTDKIDKILKEHNLEDIMDIIKQNRTKKIKSEIKIY